MNPEVIIFELEDSNNHLPSPFQQLPDDVLREILVMCIDKRKYPTFDTRTAPLLLTRISSRVRSVALQTPRLWIAVHMEIGPPGTMEIEPPLLEEPPWTSNLDFYQAQTTKVKSKAREQSAELQRWLLERSGVLPLSISITQCATTAPFFRDVADEVMEILLACAPRWEHISFNFFSSYLPQITALNHTKFPYLKSLHLQFCMRGGAALHHAPLLQAKNLKELTLTHCDLKIVNNLVSWGNLTSLAFSQSLWTFGSNTAYWMYNILGLTKRLVHCSFHFPERETEPPVNNISLPFLETITVNQPGETISFSILAHINAPSLRRVVSNNILCYPKELPTLFSRSRNVKELYLAYALLDQLVSDLRCCPTLETLRILSMQVSFQIYFLPLIDALVNVPDSQRICPNLSSFRCSSPLSISAEDVRRLYRRKRSSGGEAGGWKDLTIKCLHLEGQREIERLSSEVPFIEGKADVKDPDTW